jgi:hypothetical protein
VFDHVGAKLVGGNVTGVDRLAGEAVAWVVAGSFLVYLGQRGHEPVDLFGEHVSR